MANTNLTNLTNITTTAQPTPNGPPIDLAASFLGSGIVLVFISPLTVVLNGLLLITIFRDPFKTFQTPVAVFLVGLAFTDLMTGLVVEPLVLSCYFFHYFQHPHAVNLCPQIYHKIGIMAIAVSNSSFLIVFAFTVAQYLAVSRPLKYKGSITNRRSIMCVGLIWTYAVMFAVLRELGVPKELVEKLNLFLHSTLVLVLMIVFYSLLHRSFSRKVKRGFTLRAESSMQQDTTNNGHANRHSKQSKQLEMEQRFVRINLMLVLILIFCTVPNTITWYLFLFNEDMKRNPKLSLARVVVDNALWLKFMLDPVVYAWRLAKYRKALKTTLSISQK